MCAGNGVGPITSQRAAWRRESFKGSASIPDVSNRRTVWTIYAVNFLNSIGMWFFLPLLPILVGRKGGSAALVGVVFAAGLLSNALVRYPSGWASDRFGTRMVLVVSMLGTAALFLAYLLPMPVGAFIVVRLLHGAAQGAFYPAANGLLAEVTAPSQRGRAFGYMQATLTAGMLIGPAVGGFIALLNIGYAFAIAAAFSAVTVVALATLPNIKAQPAVEAPTRALGIARRLLPLIVLGAGTSWMIGVFDTIWSLYLTSRGASTFAVGLSFVAFAVPATLLSGYAGSLGDRFGARRIIVSALLCTAFFAAIYPFIASVPWLIGLGLLEGAFTISGLPSTMAEVSRLSEPGQSARTQGVFQTAQTLVQIVAALAGGALFTLGPPYAFLSITAVCVLGAIFGVAPGGVVIRPARETL